MGSDRIADRYGRINGLLVSSPKSNLVFPVRFVISIFNYAEMLSDAIFSFNKMIIIQELPLFQPAVGIIH